MLAPILDDPEYKAGQLGWKGGRARSKMELVLRCAWAFMRKKVIAAPKDLIGVLIFNTVSIRLLSLDGYGQNQSRRSRLMRLAVALQEESTKSGHGTIRNSQLAFDLTQVNAKMIQDLHDLLRGELHVSQGLTCESELLIRAGILPTPLTPAAEHDPDHLARLYTPRTDSNITDVGSAFRDASTVFRTRMPNTGAKRIFLVTDNDDPSKGQPEQLKAAVNNRRDLLDLGYDLDPFFVPPTKGDEFNLDKFYSVSCVESRWVWLRR